MQTKEKPVVVVSHNIGISIVPALLLPKVTTGGDLYVNPKFIVVMLVIPLAGTLVNVNAPLVVLVPYFDESKV